MPPPIRLERSEENAASAHSARPGQRSLSPVRLATWLWVVFAIAITVAVLVNPKHHRTNGAYWTAANAFLRSKPMYTPGQHGFIYPIQAALVYVPFALGPRVPFDILWRLTGIAGLAFGTWRLARLRSEERPLERPSVFLLLSLLLIPAAIGAARNGQMNLHIAAILALATAAVATYRWRSAALWLALALACKPISIVFVLLFTALHRPLWWRVPLALLVVALAPFLHPHWRYVAEQYAAGLRKVVEAGEPGAGVFADLTSLLRLVHAEPPEEVMQAVRALAAVATLGVCWLAGLRLGRTQAVVLTLGAAAAYLMLFNPRTEGNTYVILAVPMAAWAAWSVAADTHRARGVLLIAACLLLGFGHFLVYRQRDRWIRPAVAAAAYLWLTVAGVSRRVEQTLPPVATQEDATGP